MLKFEVSDLQTRSPSRPPADNMEVVYVYQRKRKEFGKQPLFSDRPAEVTASFPPDHSYMKNYVERNPCHTEAQATHEISEHEVILFYSGQH